MSSRSISASYASGLLNAELETDRIAVLNGGISWKTGIPSLDNSLPERLWTGGLILGMGSIDEPKGVKSSSPSPSLPLEIVTNHLLDLTPNSMTSPAVFIVCPPAQTASTIPRLNNNLSRPHHAHPPSGGHKVDPKTLLDSISLLQYLDISGLLESLAEVSSSLSESPPQRRIVLLQGLTATLATMQRRHGTVQAAAMVTSVGQALRALKRVTGGLCLCLIELDIIRKGSGEKDGEDVYAGSEKSREKVSGTLQTAFTAKEAGEMRIDIHPVLRGLVERTMDTIIVVHDAAGKTEGKTKVVEVVRDERMGEGFENSIAGEEVRTSLGRWAVWR